MPATKNRSFVGLQDGFYKKKGPGLLCAEKKETPRRLVLLTARRVPDVMFFLPARRVRSVSLSALQKRLK